MRPRSATGGDEVRLWEIPDPVPGWTLPIHATAVRRLTFAPDSMHLAAATVEGDVFIWHLAAAERRLSALGLRR